MAKTYDVYGMNIKKNRIFAGYFDLGNGNVIFLFVFSFRNLFFLLADGVSAAFYPFVVYQYDGG